MASSSSRNEEDIPESEMKCVCAIMAALDKTPCKNIDSDWFPYQSKLTIVEIADKAPTHTIGFCLTESEADYIVTSNNSLAPLQARDLSQGFGCKIEALDLRTCEKHEVTVMKNHKGEFIFDWGSALREARLSSDQDVAFGAYNFAWIDRAGRQRPAHGVFFTTV